LLIAKLLLPSTKIPLYELEYDKTYIFTDKAYDERYEDIPGVVDCYNDGYEQVLHKNMMEIEPTNV